MVAAEATFSVGHGSGLAGGATAGRGSLDSVWTGVDTTPYTKGDERFLHDRGPDRENRNHDPRRKFYAFRVVSGLSAGGVRLLHQPAAGSGFGVLCVLFDDRNRDLWAADLEPAAAPHGELRRHLSLRWIPFRGGGVDSGAGGLWNALGAG